MRENEKKIIKQQDNEWDVVCLLFCCLLMSTSKLRIQNKIKRRMEHPGR